MRGDETIVDKAESGEGVESISQLYLFLARCFSYPGDGFCEVIRDKGLEDEIRGWVEGLPFEVNFQGIPSPSLPQDEFESQYINFDLESPLSCPLYEFDYRSDELTRVEILEELLRFYEHFDIRLSDREKDYPDHLVAELEFMAFLTQKEASALKRGKDPAPYRRAQLDFLDRHLGRWVRLLDERIQRNVNEPFYRGIGELMAEFVGNHLSYLKEGKESFPP